MSLNHPLIILAIGGEITNTLRWSSNLILALWENVKSETDL